MSRAIVLFQAAGSGEWTRIHTEEFKERATTYAEVRCGSHAVELQHAPLGGHTLILTEGGTRVVVWPTGGNEPDDSVPETIYDLQVVGHYDIPGLKGETYRLYHQRSQREQLR